MCIRDSDDDDDDDDGDHDDDDEDADVDVDVDVDGDELAAILSHYCSSNKSKSTPVHGMWPHGKPVSEMTCGRMVVESLWLQWPVAAGCGKPVAAGCGSMAFRAASCGRYLLVS